MWFKADPGPCPVDDVPYTACCSPDYQGIVIPQLPGRDQMVAAEPIPVPAPLGSDQVLDTFTTKTYRSKRAR
jgi:hypothetical protein